MIADLKHDLLVELIIIFLVSIIFYLYRKVILSGLKYINSYIFFSSFEPRHKYFFRLGKSESHSVDIQRDSLERSTFFGAIKPPTMYGRYDRKKKVIVDIPKTSLHKRYSKYVPSRLLPFNLSINSRYVGKKSQSINVQAQYIVSNLFLPAIMSNEPELIIIDGKIGCGKTTLISQLGETLHKHNIKDKNKIKLLSIHIDLRESLYVLDENKPELNHDITGEFLIEEIKNIITNTFRRYLIEAKVPISMDDYHFDELINKCYENQISPIVFIDELDFLYYDFAKRITSIKGLPSDNIIKSYHNLINFLFNFHQEYCPIYEHKPAAVNTIIVLAARTNSYRFFKEISTKRTASSLRTINLSGENKIFNQHLISITPPTPSRLHEVIEKRFTTAIKILAKSPASGNTNTLSNNLDEVLTNLKVDGFDFDSSLKVSVHGMRHVLNIIARLHAHDENASLLREILSNNRLFILYQYLDGNPEYSQAHEGVTNLFLINKDFTESKFNDRPNHSNNFEQELFDEHLQTYWLKYFIMQMVVELADNDTNWIDSGLVIDSFIGKYKSSCSYEKSIVYLTLLNLFEIDSGRLLKYKYDVRLQLRPTSRFLYMNKEGLYWTFEYLMVIVEDSWLNIPRTLHTDFVITHEWQKTFNFVTNIHKLSNAEKVRFIKYKISLVVKFLNILQASLNAETQLYSDSFSEIHGKKIEMPNFEDIYITMRSQISSFTEDLVGKDFISSTISHYDGLINLSDSIQSALSNLYSKYHKHHCLWPFTKEKKMHKYHDSI